MRIFRVSAVAVLFAAACFSDTSLDGSWSIASSADIHADGQAISGPSYDTAGWIKAQVPSTVVAALVSAKIFSNPDFGMNLREMSGVTYPSGYNFATIPMPPGSPFRVSWWYRRVFRSPTSTRRQWLHLDGINFRANIWINGKRVADSHRAFSNLT